MSETIDLLKEFAKTQGIDVKEVDKFLKQYDNPKTLDELIALPNNLLNHYSYIGDVKDPLYSFIKDDMWCERYQTVELDTVVDIVLDRKYGLVQDLLGDDVDFDEVDYDSLEIEDEEIKQKLDNLLKIEKYLIDSKFGSVEYDW
jgi:hypothetical protein